MELIDILPEFNLYDEYWKIYTNNNMITPLYVADGSVVERCIIGEGSEIYGEVYNSVIGSGVTIEEGTVVRDSIIMGDTYIGKNCVIDKGIIAENVKIGDDVVLSVGEYAESALNPKVYAFDLVTIAENSSIPSGVKIGKNTAIVGKTAIDDYPGGLLASGQAIVKAGDI
jgi:glucose-1-phosphate adenylyltransferase